MNRFRGPQYTRSKATPDTLCQKCLKRGHYSYECTAKAQDRPYTSRPSRTQQLLHPKLAPQLSSDEPNDLTRTKGIADEQLSKREAERTPGPHRDDADGRPARRKHSRSGSSRSSSSVSTISSNLSESTPKRGNIRKRVRSISSGKGDKSKALDGSSFERKRRRSTTTSSSASDNPEFSQHIGIAESRDRHTRRRLSSYSPLARGRRTNRSPSGGSMDRSRSSSLSRRRRSRRRRSRSRSSSSRRERISRRRPRRTSSPQPPQRYHDGQISNSHRQSGPMASSSRDGHDGRRNGTFHDAHRAPRRERSLSPYSKRIALTQAMSMDKTP